MERDCIECVWKCHKCQVFTDKIHAPLVSLYSMIAHWPFAMWGMDVIGKIKLKASNGHWFILVAIDYFTKWVEATSYARFIEKNIICWYGFPEAFVINNA